MKFAFHSSSLECDLPAKADLTVHSFTNKNDADASETKASIQFLNWNKASCDVTGPNGTATLELDPGFTIIWQYFHLEEITEKIIRDPENVMISNESKYEITGWEAPGNDDIVTRKVYDNTETPGQGTTLSEKTTIEIRKK